MKRRLLISSITILPWLRAQADDNDKKPEIPFSIPFPGMGKVGAKLTIDMVCPKKPNPWYALLAPEPVGRTQTHLIWSMYLGFRFKDGDLNDFNRVGMFAGINGKPGVPVQLRIRIKPIEGPSGQFVYDQVVSVYSSSHSEGNGYINRTIDSIRLVPGVYHLEVENLSDIPELLNEELNFVISHSTGK